MMASPRNDLTEVELRQLHQAKFVQILPAGANIVPFGAIAPGVVIASNAGAYAQPMAEHVMAMVLALAKNIVVKHDELRSGRWDRSEDSRSLAGKTVGIVGFGGIGRAVAGLTRAFSMRIMAINSRGKTDEPVEFVGTPADLPAVLVASEVVVIAVPLTKTTAGMIGREQLRSMRPDAILINVARGNVVDEDALYEHALQNAGFRVGLDVWWAEPFQAGLFHTNRPLLKLPNVIGSPHNSAQTAGIGQVAMSRAGENIRRFLRGEPLTGVVDRAQYV